MDSGYDGETAFAPARRSPPRIVERQAGQFNEPVAKEMLAAIPDVFLVLNRQRQIVYANPALLAMFSLPATDTVLGKRPGEAFGCIHSVVMPAGCGTSEFCRNCGAIQAILEATDGRRAVQDCRILRLNGEALDLRIWASPLDLHDERFTLCAIADISHEKRRRVLERIFFHDLLNTAGGLLGYTELLDKADDDAEVALYKQTLHRLARHLVDEIGSQRELAAAESGELQPRPAPVDPFEVGSDLRRLYQGHDVARGKAIVLADFPPVVGLVSDGQLLRRVIGNMLKNALEATPAGGTVRLGGRRVDDGYEFWVANAGAMPRDVQMQIFQRSFSTKGTARGVGTYSMKLIAERYLKGRIGFASSPDQGTVFTCRLPLVLD